jgi:hypothetical protein
MPKQSIVNHSRFALLAALASAFASCDGNEVKYTPKPAPTVKANLPSVPSIPQRPIKNGEAYTVWGASYHLRSRVYNSSVAGKDIVLEGYIVKTNLPEAPECAVHETGKEDPEDCKPPIPTFWIADSKDAPLGEAMKVMGWASNYAQIYDAVKEYKKRERHPTKTEKDEEPLMDAFWGVALPDPLPVKGAKVRVKGEYAMTFTKATTGAEADPIMGILTYSEMEYLEKPSEVATLPGMK